MTLLKPLNYAIKRDGADDGITDWKEEFRETFGMDATVGLEHLSWEDRFDHMAKLVDANWVDAAEYWEQWGLGTE